MKGKEEHMNNNNNSVWTITEGLALCIELEKFFTEKYPDTLHVALAGSLLYRGTSDKDIDLFVYPHTAYNLTENEIHNILEEFGMCLTFTTDKLIAKKERPHYPYLDLADKRVSVWTYKGKRVDLFLPWTTKNA